MRYCQNKDIDRLISKLVHAGWTFSKGRHGKLRPPGGSGCITVSLTPSDGQAVHAVRRDVKRLADALCFDLSPVI